LPPSDDDTLPGAIPAHDYDTVVTPPARESFPAGGDDSVSAGDGSPAAGDSIPVHGDETVTAGGAFPARDGDTAFVRAVDDTLPDGDLPAVPGGDAPAAGRPDSTAVMPSPEDWAPSRANPAWSGRAEVRAPQPARTGYDADWAERPRPVQRDHWWMPIVVGLVVLVMLAVLGWAVFLIVQSVDREEAPSPSPSATAATSTAPATSQATTTPTTAPTTTTPTPTPSTTEPTTTEVTVPALRGLALADAQAALKRTGLSYRLIYRDGDAPPGTVIDCDPAEGQEVPPDTTVTLVVAQGATTTPTGAATTTAGPTVGTGVGGD
jgi:hypothetical protein